MTHESKDANRVVQDQTVPTLFDQKAFKAFQVGPSINELVTDGNTKLCCRGFILVLFQSTTANKIYSEQSQDYKRLLPVYEAEIL